MNNKIMPMDTLYGVTMDYIESEVEKFEKMGGTCFPTSTDDTFDLFFIIDNNHASRAISVVLCDDNHWEISNGDYVESNVNIRVYPNRVEFVEESEFNDFSKEFMYGLYEKIKSYVEDDSMKNDFTVNLGSITFNYKDTQVSIEGISIKCCGDGNIQEIIAQIKDLYKSFTTGINTNDCVTKKEVTECEAVTDKPVEKKEEKEETKENDIEGIWMSIKNSGLFETGRCGEIELSYDNKSDREYINFYHEKECIQLSIKTARISDPLWFYLHRDPLDCGFNCFEDEINVENMILSIRNEEIRKFVDDIIKKALRKH